MAFRLARLPRGVPLTEEGGGVSFKFQRWWQSVVEKIEAQEAIQDQALTDIATTQAELTTAQTDLATAQTDLAAAVADITAAQTDIATIESTLSGVVLQDQGAAWTAATGTASRAALASYAGQTVSNPPTQAEMQTLDDAVKAMSQAMVALITDLQANGALT